MRYLYTSLRRWSLSLLTCSLLASSLSAQTDNDVQPDRPDHSEGTSVLRPRSLQIEWGIGASSGHHSMGLMLRYGLVPDLELRLEGLLQRPHRGAVQVSDLTLSSKLALFSGDGWIPAMTLVGYLNYAPHEETRRVGPTEHGCDLGLSYAVTKDFLVDLSCGRTFFASGAVNYASLGATYRL